eukprot:CAMPEP_0206048240 /NCGR_PEP_ID=MMETSP1466-20131121/23582_1 /ASSEMBLY_ACC=CAM_ASM_001126 /TAXON_ID=44452 /ORGANISM="Pavlova gyrans, Strain CCMP608" /LENGTH=75 /DNA_ID=CAMNT_0053423285 /DNA_START=313 /DNA_END=537 /DNA_ORIENTATION=+
MTEGDRDIRDAQRQEGTTGEEACDAPEEQAAAQAKTTNRARVARADEGLDPSLTVHPRRQSRDSICTGRGIAGCP